MFSRVSDLDRRTFMKLLAVASAHVLPACGPGDRYHPDEAEALEEQRRAELERSGSGPFGARRYSGYRGLAELPWFEADEAGRLRCVDETIPRSWDIHAHLGMSLLLAPDVDLHARTDRVQYILDCDGEEPVCPIDLDVYINANFREHDLDALYRNSVMQLVFGSSPASTHTIPNLLAEMDGVRVERAAILPIAFGLPFGDDLTERWIAAIEEEDAGARLITGASVHPRDESAVEKLRDYARRGARIVKLHPAGQRFFPDDPQLAPIYEECGRLGLPVFFHGGRAGIEPAYTHRFTLIRHYEGAFRAHPDVRFVLGHAGARDVADAIPMAQRYDNVWLGIHGQGVSSLGELVERVGPHRLLFGSDWPFYPLAATLAKVLVVTEGRPDVREAILRGNAERLFA